MSALGVRNLAGYNRKIATREKAGRPDPEPVLADAGAPEPLDTLPHIVVVIDELADLMMVVGKKVEELIARLAQKARAAGIHLILATQRPSVDVITGLIKANIPTRILPGVEQDRLAHHPRPDGRRGAARAGRHALPAAGHRLPQRVHGAFVADDEVHRSSST
jgi:S-DNA-T family DNA segregation ATPase FtsK/SpoIIIE